MRFDLPPDLVPRALRWTAAALLLAAAALPASAQQGSRQRPFTGTELVTAVDLVVEVRDRDGGVPADLRPQDFEVLEDGSPVKVIGVERLSGAPAGPAPEDRRRDEPAPGTAADSSWRLVIYIDQTLSSSRSIRRACEALAAQAGTLTRLGPVELVIASPTPTVVLRPTRSAHLLEQTLERVARETPGRDALRQIRKQFVEHMLLKGELDGTGVPTVAGARFRGSQGGGQGGAGETLTNIGDQGPAIIRDGALFSRETLARASLAEELVLMRAQHDSLMAWLAGYDLSGPRALLLVSDGYDLDPRNFYLTGAIAGSQLVSTLAAQLQDREIAQDSDALAQVLAAGGWVAVNLAVGALESGQTMGADVSGKGRVGDLVVAKDNTVSELPSALVLQPLAPLNRLASATGGETLTGVGKLPAALGRLSERFRLTYQVSRPADGTIREVEVRPLRSGLEVKAPRWAGSPAPERIAASRARRLLTGAADRGELPVVGAVALEPLASADDAMPDRRRGRLQARVDLRSMRQSLPAAGNTPVRVTIAASLAEGKPFVHHDRIDHQSLAGLDAWTYALPITLPGETRKVSVVFEDLTTGAWGGALAAIVEGELPPAVQAAGASDADASAAAVPQDLLPDRKALVLVPPAETVVRGKILLEPLIASAGVARVEYLLDGRKVASSDRPPFAARVDFGELPSPHLVEAVGLAADGSEVGRDALAVNEGVGSFRVRIIEPRSGDRVGSVDVEAEVNLPGGGAGLDRVEVTWNGERVATLFEPPFRARVFVPPDAPVGYVQVVAHRGDGTSAEDLVFLNGTGPAERVEVQLVELFTVVEDPGQHPVRGLGAEDFQVYEDGVEQSLADFRDGAEVPLSIGMVIDTSASMTPSLRAAQAAAIDFLLLSLRGEQDRAFVVGFDSRPQLVQPLTSSREELVDGIARLAPGGTSALCDALVFSLVQMQRIPGRRAMVVLTDGVGREERVDYGTCLRFVQRSGIPLYAVLLAGDDPTATGRGGFDVAQLEPLVGSVGGRLFVVTDPQRLGGVYRAVIDELRSQYLLTYYPSRGPSSGEGWREIEVAVDRPGLVARTVAGYYP